MMGPFLMEEKAFSPFHASTCTFVGKPNDLFKFLAKFGIVYVSLEIFIRFIQSLNSNYSGICGMSIQIYLHAIPYDTLLSEL